MGVSRFIQALPCFHTWSSRLQHGLCQAILSGKLRPRWDDVGAWASMNGGGGCVHVKRYGILKTEGTCFLGRRVAAHVNMPWGRAGSASGWCDCRKLGLQLRSGDLSACGLLTSCLFAVNMVSMSCLHCSFHLTHACRCGHPSGMTVPGSAGAPAVWQRATSSCPACCNRSAPERSQMQRSPMEWHSPTPGTWHHALLMSLCTSTSLYCSLAHQFGTVSRPARFCTWDWPNDPL